MQVDCVIRSFFGSVAQRKEAICVRHVHRGLRHLAEGSITIKGTLSHAGCKGTHLSGVEHESCLCTISSLSAYG